jgi:hypothetical protein
MFIVNVTFNASDEIFMKWKKFMLSYFIPQSMKEGGFSEYQLFKILLDEETGGQTYSIQFSSENPIKIDNYLKKIFPEFQEEMIQSFGQNVVAFATPIKKTTLE